MRERERQHRDCTVLREGERALQKRERERERERELDQKEREGAREESARVLAVFSRGRKFDNRTDRVKRTAVSTTTGVHDNRTDWSL